MKKLLSIFAALSLFGFCNAQDQLFKKDNTKLLVRITEISPDEIKYKLFDNLTGPTYVVRKSDVSLLIYENGKHEVINTPAENVSVPRQIIVPTTRHYGMSKEDSLKFFRYTESVSLNFLTFMNMEIGLIYQKDFLKSNCSLIIPLAIGIHSPSVTEAVYFSGFNGDGINLNRKLFEAGLGLNYYPSLKHAVQYYVGPAIRYMQYSYQQVYQYYSPGPGYPNYGPGTTKVITANGTLSRFCVSITNGFMFRTRSRLVINIFGSLGFKNDITNTKIIDPNTNQEIKPIVNPVNIYLWSGFALGFGF